MNIQMIKIENIKEPIKSIQRTPLYEQFVNSIKEKGILVPIVLYPNMEILDGKYRYFAAKELGIKEIPCHVSSIINRFSIDRSVEDGE